MTCMTRAARFAAGLLTAALLLALVPAADAVNITWNLTTGGAWDTAAANWTGDSTLFTDGGVDNVTFNKTNGGTITIAAGMTPLSTTVSATSGTYTFQGVAGSIDGGTLTKSGNGQLDINTAGLLANVTLVMNGGTLRLPTQQTVLSLAGTGGNINWQGSGLTIGGDGSSTTFAGTTSGHGSFTKNGGGVFTFSGSAFNASAGFNIDDGTFRLGASNGIGSGNTPSIKDGATFDLNGFNQTLASVTLQGGSTILGGGGLLTITGNSRPFSGISGGTGTIAQVTSDVHFSSTSLISLDIRTNASSAGITQVFDGAISGASGGITSTGNTSGSAVLRLSGSTSNTFTGDFSFDRGTVELNKSGGAIAIPTNVSYVNGGTLKWLQPDQIADTATLTFGSGAMNLNGNNETVARLIVTNSGGFDTSSSATLTLGAASGDVISFGTGLNQTKRLGVNVVLSGAGGDLQFTADTNQNRVMQIGTDTVGERTLALGTPVRTITVSGTSTNVNLPQGIEARVTSVISGTGGIVKAGTGDLQLSAANSYSGDTRVDGGTLNLGNNLSLQNSAFDTSGGGALTFATGVNTPTFGGLKGSGALALPASVTALTLNTAADAAPDGAGNLSGGTSMSLTKTGAGTQILSGSNSYSGPTNVNQGSLLVNGTHTGGGAYTVAPGATLGGTGTIDPAGTATVSAAGTSGNAATLSPGASIGTLTVGALASPNDVILGDHSLLLIENNWATADKLMVYGNVDLTSALDALHVLGSGAPWSGTIVETVGGTINGTFGSVTWGGLLTGVSVFYTPTTVSIEAVPEPAALALLALGGLLALRRRAGR